MVAPRARRPDSSTERSRWRRFALTTALAIALLAGPCVVRTAFAQAPDEYEVKAAFLYNFAKFVQWPPGAFTSPADPLRICVLGDDPFRGALEEIVAGKTVHGHEIVIWHIGPDQAGQCHVLFFGSLERHRLRHTLTSVADSHVLTVGDDDEFVGDGVMIAFRIEENRVRFIINTRTAAEAGIEISSQLLKVAANVIPESQPPR